MEQTFDETPRTYVIRRSQHKGYGFVAGYEFPTMVKRVEDDGPSFERLQPGDIIMAVNGIDVQDTNREQIIKMIQLSKDYIEITVRKLSYGELIRAKNLADPKFYQLNDNNGNKSHHHNNTTMSTTTTAKPMQYHNPSSLSVDNQWQFNRLVTPISQQHQNLKQPSSQNSTSNSASELDSPSSMQVSRNHANPYGSRPLLEHKSSLNQQSKLDIANDNNNNTIVKGDNFIDITKKNNGASYGRFSPVPQRCKSSMDGAQGNQRNKKSNNEDQEQPLLKRRNTMRPIKPTTIMPPPEVRKILQSVIKIFFEDGHSRALKYDPTTTVGDILDILNERLGKSPDHLEQVKGYFGLALTLEVESSCKLKDKAPKLHILDEGDIIVKIAQLHYSDRLRLLYRMIHPPSDVYGLYKQSKLAFEYLYQQSRNDLKLERFSPELDEDTALKLSALHLLEYVHSNHSKAHGNSKDPKVYIELIKKTRGIEYFVPASMVESVLDKDGKRIVSQYKKLKAKLIKQLKKNFEEFNLEPPQVRSTTDINRFSTTSFHELILPEMHSSPSDYIKLLFLNYLSKLTCYGNPTKPVKASTSPMEQTSSGDCSSSLESVPRTSDSSPLIKQDRNQFSHVNNASSINNISNLNTTNNGRPNNMNIESIARLPQMNSLRSLNSIRSPSQSQSVDQTDMAATPSIESISSITFNIQNSPSPPEAAPPYLASSSEPYNNNLTTSATTVIGGPGPSPMPRHHQALSQKRSDSNSIDKLYNQRYLTRDRYIDDLPRNIIILPPPPPPSSLMFDDIKYQLASGKMVNYSSPASMHLTQVLTDKDIEKLRVPPPPKLTN